MTPWTRTLSLDDAHTALASARPGVEVREWASRAASEVETSPARRRELVRLVRDHMLDVDDGYIANGPLLDVYSRAPALAQLDIVDFAWLCSHPLGPIAVRELVANRLGDAIRIIDVDRLVAQRVRSASKESLRKTRTVLIGALENAGLLVASGTGASRKLVASRAAPHAAAFAWLLRRELGDDAMPRGYAATESEAAQISCCGIDHAGQCIEDAIDAGWLADRDGRLIAP